MENAKPKLIQVAFGKSDTQQYTIVRQSCSFILQHAVCVSHNRFVCVCDGLCVCVSVPFIVCRCVCM